MGMSGVHGPSTRNVRGSLPNGMDQRASEKSGTTELDLLNAFHPVGYCYGTGPVHRVENGKVLCGSHDYTELCPREYVEDRLPQDACPNCVRVHRYRKEFK